MQSWIACIALEEGLPTVAGLAVIAVLFIVGLIAIWKSRSASPRDSMTTTTDKGSLRARGLPAHILLYVLIIGLFCAFIWYLKEVYPASRVGFHSPEEAKTLEQLREDFQADTKARIVLTETAKSFAVAGGPFTGRCVPDMMAAICRQYSEQLQCVNDMVNQSIVISTR